MIAKTVSRVPEHTSDQVNERIDAQAEERVAHAADAGPQAIDCRLAELEEEWDIERTLELNFALVVLGGLGLSAAFGRRWAVLPAVASVFMVQHVLQGWCPPVPFLRRLGFRTQVEIDEERYALKALRGDFDLFSATRDRGPRADSRQALDAARS